MSKEFLAEAATGGVHRKTFTGKHLCQSLFFNKVARLRPATLLKRGSGTGVFRSSSEFCEISTNTFFTEHIWETASILDTQETTECTFTLKRVRDMITT